MTESFYTDADLTEAVPNFDATGVTLGDAMSATVDGQITHVRFRSTVTQTGGTFIGAVFPITDDDPPDTPPSPLGQATFGALTGGAWELVALSPPVDITAGQPFRPALYTSVGRYMSDSGYHSGADVTRGHLTSYGTGSVAGGFTVLNGTFNYATGLTFPDESFGAASYFVDVVFEPSAAEPAEGSAALGLDLAVAATGNADHEGSAALGLGLAVAATGGADHEGIAALGLGFAVAAEGSATAGGSAALTLGLGVAATGARDSLGAAALGLGLNIVSAGARDSLGASALGLRLAFASTGRNGEAGRPVSSFPWPPRPTSGFPWTPRPVKSFEEVTNP